MASDDDRLMSTIGMMDATSNAGDGEGVNAYRQATRILKARGMTWRDVAQRAFGPMSPTWVPPRKAEPHDQEPVPEPGVAAPNAPTERSRQRISGSSVPVTVIGTVVALDTEAQARRSRVLVFTVEGDDAIYGPIVAYAGTLMDNIFKARGRRVMLRVRPARDDGQMPQAVGCSPM